MNPIEIKQQAEEIVETYKQLSEHGKLLVSWERRDIINEALENVPAIAQAYLQAIEVLEKIEAKYASGEPVVGVHGLVSGFLAGKADT